MPKSPMKLRSAEWFGTADKNGFMYRSWMINMQTHNHNLAELAMTSSDTARSEKPTTLLRHALSEPCMLIAPGAYDDIGLTLKDDGLIRVWQQQDHSARPWVWASNPTAAA